jgi:uncharacterized protein
MRLSLRKSGAAWWFACAALLFCGFSAGCQKPADAPSAAGTVPIQIGGKVCHCEVANDERTRERGLMSRPKMADDHGMLFVFEQPQVLRFWMKNTLIPLDILFMNADGKVVAIRQMVPMDLSTTSSGEPAKYAIELNSGQAEAAGAKEGDVIHLPPLPACSRPR